MIVIASNLNLANKTSISLTLFNSLKLAGTPLSYSRHLPMHPSDVSCVPGPGLCPLAPAPGSHLSPTLTCLHSGSGHVGGNKWSPSLSSANTAENCANQNHNIRIVLRAVCGLFWKITKNEKTKLDTISCLEKAKIDVQVNYRISISSKNQVQTWTGIIKIDIQFL